MTDSARVSAASKAVDAAPRTTAFDPQRAASAYRDLRGRNARAVPRPDQAQAVASALACFASGEERCQLVAASGTGKTLLALWTAEGCRAQRVIVFEPSLALVRQTALAWAAEGDPTVALDVLCVCSDETVADDLLPTEVAAAGIPITTDPVVIADVLSHPVRERRRLIVYATYHSAGKISVAYSKTLSTALPSADLVVCDEAHVLAGREGKTFQIALDRHAVPAAHRLLLTATPRIVAPDRRRANEDGEPLVASMDDTRRFGPVADSLPFGRAIRLGLLADYRLEVLAVRDQDVTCLLQGHTDPETERNRLSLAQAAATVNALLRGDFRHAFSFHHTRRAATRFIEALHLAARRVSGSGSWVLGTVFGDTPVAERDVSLRAMIDAPAGVLGSARALLVGIDAPAVDAVLFVDPKESVVDIAQGIGRALRRDPQRPDKIAHIVVPVLVPDDLDEESVEAALDDSAWEPVWRILAALAAHDDRLEQELALAARNRARMDAGSTLERGAGRRNGDVPDGGVLDRALALALPLGLPFSRLRRAVRIRAVAEVADQWEYAFGRLAAFAEREGHARVPASHVEPDGYRLGAWAAQQRQAFRAGRLAPNRVRELERLGGWWWTRDDEDWRAGWRSLRRFVRRRGHARVPDVYWDLDGFWLGEWVERQREARAHSLIPPTRVAALAALPGWSWASSAVPPPPRAPAPDIYDTALIEAIMEQAALQPTPPLELLRTVGRGDPFPEDPREERQQQDRFAVRRRGRTRSVHPLSDWVVRDYLPAYLRAVGLERHAQTLADADPFIDRWVAKSMEWDVKVAREAVLDLLRRQVRRGHLGLLWTSIGTTITTGGGFLEGTLADTARRVVWQGEWLDVLRASEGSAVPTVADQTAVLCVLLLATRAFLSRLPREPRVLALNRAVAEARENARRAGGRYSYSSYAVAQAVVERHFPTRELWNRRLGFTGPEAPANNPLAFALWVLDAQEEARRWRLQDKVADRFGPEEHVFHHGFHQEPHRGKGGEIDHRRRLDRLGPRDQVRRHIKAFRDAQFDALAGALGLRSPSWSHGHSTRGWLAVEKPPVVRLAVERDRYESGRRLRLALTVPKESANAVHRARLLTEATLRAAEDRLADAKRAFEVATAGLTPHQKRKAAKSKPAASPSALTGVTLIVARPRRAAPNAREREFDAVWLDVREDLACLVEGVVRTVGGVVVALRGTSSPSGRLNALTVKYTTMVSHRLEERKLRVIAGEVRWDNRLSGRAGAKVVDHKSDDATAPGKWVEAEAPPVQLYSPPPLTPISRSSGSPHHSLVADGTVVNDRSERFAYNIAAARSYADTHGHLRPTKAERPSGINLYMWLKNQELRIGKGTLEPERLAALEAIPAWRERRGLAEGESEVHTRTSSESPT